jgi:GTPase SAR1 family protein
MKKDIEVIVLGEKNVGKTEIINNLLIKKSENDFHGKIEDNFHEKFGNNYYEDYIPKENCTTIEIKEDNVIKSKKLRINNIPSGRLSSINKNFLRSANIALLVFDMTNIDSFIGLYDWNELLMENENLIKCVIANKNNLFRERKISKEDGKNFAIKIGAFYFEINAFNNEDINNLFGKIMKIYSESNEEMHQNSIFLKKKKKREKGCCKGGDSFDGFDDDYSGILYHIKLTNSKKEKNEIINGNEDNKNNGEKEIIKYINGNTKEILDENPDKSIFYFNNGDTFKGEMNEDNNFITGKLEIKDLEIDIYDKKIVNLINALLYVNNPKILELNNDLEEEYYTLDNNFVIKIEFVFEKMALDDNMLNDKNLILFIYDKFEQDFDIKFKIIIQKIQILKI